MFIIGFFFFGGLLLSTTILYKDVAYFNCYVKGTIINIETQDQDSDNGISTVYNYKIRSKKSVYETKSTEVFELNDSVFGMEKGNNKMKLLSVNNEHVNEKYDMEDFFSLLIILGFIFWCIRKVLKNRIFLK
ncbi:hypothetical protein KHA90_17295 [Flavobacterium psychroterrae]|uniref:DUF3592 domain-containing protein n=1 Tax=Flavobacterium psychroterrae TaxID=2133767 RepID=A0ABS5PGE7_9FLAO|nr:hypothetical protein [Flavobacterium psychroterrae]MBS7232776.1 hypothetical protein [Flavobacterium psychroterrae]